MSAEVAAGLVAGCIAALVPGSAAADRRLGLATQRREPRPGRPPRRRWLVAAAGSALLATAISGAGARILVLAVAAVPLVLAGRRILGGWRARRVRQARRRLVIGFCDALSAELRGGLPAAVALERSCDRDELLRPAAVAARLGGDIPLALRGCASASGAEGLRAVAAVWEVAGHAGAALAGVLDRVAVGLRHDEDARAEVDAALGPPRATALMLAVLPVFGLGLGATIGAHPLGFLLGSTWGLACGATGAVLAVVGMWWVEALASAAED